MPMRTSKILIVTALLLSSVTSAYAQFNLKGLAEKAKKAVEEAGASVDKVTSSIPAAQGKTY